MKEIDIFIKSFKRDFKLLNYALRSIEKNVTGYRKIKLLIPAHDGKEFIEQIEIPKGIDPFISLHFIAEYGVGYLFQQLCKIQAHKYSDAEFIMYADSDCIFDKPINVQDLIKDGKSEILYTDYEKVGDALCWKKPTEDFIKEPVQFEFMRRLPLIYKRSTLQAIEKYEPNLEHQIMNSERFSEFNAIGAFAFKYERDGYNFINTDNWTYSDPIHIQLWSHAEKDNQNAPHPYEYNRIIETIRTVFNEEFI